MTNPRSFCFTFYLQLTPWGSGWTMLRQDFQVLSPRAGARISGAVSS